jgi:hypothetical protein
MNKCSVSNSSYKRFKTRHTRKKNKTRHDALKRLRRVLRGKRRAIIDQPSVHFRAIRDQMQLGPGLVG